MKKAVKITLIAVGALVLLAALTLAFVPKILAQEIYKDNFGCRYETYLPTASNIEDFDGLMREKYTFSSNEGQMLTGYRYYKENTDVKAALVLAHGFGGGGHNSYMNVANYFAGSGYEVFAYDVTGNDESEGECVNGLPQGLIDLDYALRFVKENENFAGLPIVLWGHSWGAYSVGSVLRLHPDVKAAVMVSGFDRSIDMIEAEGKRLAGDMVNMVLPDMEKLEEQKFGEYAKIGCSDGLSATGAGVMLIHSADDEMIDKAISFDVFKDKFGSDPRFRFIEYDGRGHSYVFHSDNARAYIDEFNENFDEYIAGLEGGFTPEAKAQYLSENLDKKRLNELDGELFGQMLRFYDEYLV